eukprot:Selendium_serpulae@DN3746_c0_g2_i1.p1
MYNNRRQSRDCSNAFFGEILQTASSLSGCKAKPNQIASANVRRRAKEGDGSRSNMGRVLKKMIVKKMIVKCEKDETAESLTALRFGSKLCRALQSGDRVETQRSK